MAAAARLVATHARLGLGSGVLLCVPVPEADAYPLADARAAVERAIADAEAAADRGSGPHALAARPRRPRSPAARSVRANVALIVNNARVAGQLAVALAAQR